MRDKNIIIGVTGGIAAYKATELIRLLITCGANVKVVMTKNATEFITPLTLRTLSNNAVYTQMFGQELAVNLEHISLARWADAVVIAPGSANFIAKLTHGFADDLLSTICLATTAPIAIAPSMNQEMWEKNVVKENINILNKRGIFIFGPTFGIQACGEIGLGRMLEPKKIFEKITLLFSSKILDRKKIVITAGPTQEMIDPTRYISNRSSGKMGYALATAAKETGADVVLISGPTNLEIPYKNQIKFINITTALELQQAVMSEIADCDIFIGAAAVSDYRPNTQHPRKIKKNSSTINLKLVCNPDILLEVSSLIQRPFTVGFAAETDNLLENAKKKLLYKNLDMIVANQVGKNVGFDAEEHAVTILFKNNAQIECAKTSKYKLAKQIIEHIVARLKL